MATKILEWLVHILRWTFAPVYEIDGMYCVHYHDGNTTRRMSYRVACTYASMFGGNIFHDKEKNHS